MMLLSEILEGIEGGREVLVKLSDGNCFGLADFEMVDESIYERSDLCLCNIVSKIKVKRDVYKVGSKLEFSVDDVIEIQYVENGRVLYKKYKE